MNDKLSQIFSAQQAFNRRCGLDTSTPLTDADKQLWIDRLCTAIAQETAELRDSVSWKWWRSGNFDAQNCRVEIVDILCFLVTSAQVMGMSPDDLFLAYEAKMGVNHTRQDNGEMVGAERNPEDSRHI